MWQKILFVMGLIIVLIVAAIGGGIGKQVGKAAFAPDKPSPEQVQNALIQGLEKAAQQINDRGPVMVDKETRMDRASVGPGPRLTYHYTFPGHSSQELDASWLYANLRPTIRGNVCSNNDMSPSLKHGATYSYSYSARDGIKLMSFDVSQKDCEPSSAAPTYTSEGWTQESTGSTEIGSWLERSPPGTRYYRDASRTIYRVYPPGVRPGAEKANPFGLGDSTEYVPQ